MPLTLSHAQGSTDEPIVDKTIGDVLKDAAAACPDRLAIIADNGDPDTYREWTYAELYDEALCLARALRSRFEPGERVAIWAPNISEWIVTEFGSAMAGTILVTVNPSYQPHEVEYVLNQSRSAGILVMSDFRGNQMAKHVETVREKCPELREVILFDDWEALIAEGRSSDITLPEVKADDPCMIQYTSGTTGFPKGALLHHKGLVNNGAHTTKRMGAGEGDRIVTMMPLFHTAGCVVCVLGALGIHGTQVLIEQFDPGHVLKMIEKHKVKSLMGVPTMLIALMEHPAFTECDLSSLKFACSGGSTVPAALVKRLQETLGVEFTIVFGQTECSPVASMTKPTDTLEDKADTLGLPMPHVEVKIVDPESGETLPVGEAGEYCTRGYHVMHGYYENEEATTSAIDAGGWLFTGDLASMDDRGFTRIEGRLKDMIIRGGENIYPREIEDLLFKHNSVGEVAVVGLPDDRLGEVVGVFLRPAPGQAIDKDGLFAYLRESLSPQKTPKHWFELEEFPLTGSGKIQKFVLRDEWKKGAFTEL
jgi:fatty-acyl-CoA synthase